MMFDLIRKTFVKNNAEALEGIEKVAGFYDKFQSKIILFFIFWFIFVFFIFLVMLSIALTGFIATGKIPQDVRIYFIAGDIAAILFSFLSFKLMRGAWRKLRQPAEKELKLKL